MHASWMFLAVWLTISLSFVQCSAVKKQSGKDDGDDVIRDKVKELLRKLDKAADDGDDDEGDELQLQEADHDEPQPVNFNYGNGDDDGPQPYDGEEDKPVPYNMFENDKSEDDDDDDALGTETDDGAPQPAVYSHLCGKPVITPRSTAQARIVGGVEARPNSWPWQCDLQVRKRGRFGHICGASVISNSWLVTAAHCVVHSRHNITVKPASLFLVRCGKHDRTVREQHQQIRRVQEIIRHPRYISRFFDRDIAVIRVRSPLTYNNYVRPVCLPTTSPSLNDPVTVTGWGATQNTGSNRVLRQVTLFFIPSRTCNSYLHGRGMITPSMVCAGNSRGGKGSCYGDSGGPLIYYTDGRFQLQGIVSWSLAGKCARPDNPGVYVDVRRFLRWIRDTTGVAPPPS